MILLIIGIAPSLIVGFGIVNSYKSRAVSICTENVRNQCDLLCEEIVRDGYLEDPSQAALNSELELLSQMYDGRVMVINAEYRILKDTSQQDEGTTLATDLAEACFSSGEFAFRAGESNIEMIAPIKNESGIVGGMAVYVPMAQIRESTYILEERGAVILGITILLVMILGYFISGMLVKPFKKVTTAMEGISDGYLEEEICVPDYAETQLITDAFNSIMKKMRVLDESRSEFVSNVSHELKTPLTSMKVLADSLVGQQGVPEELYQEFMSDITQEIDRENKIITDLLSLVKMDKKANLNLQVVTINDLLDLIIRRLKPIAARKNIRLLVDSFRPVNAQVDEVKLTLAISNLVENGIKYNVEDGWVRVSLNADNKYFYIVVADSGMGIPEEELDHIFERFYRVDKSHSREIGGTGLGLAITKSAIMMHHGAIKVYSKEGEGTKFSVRIPLEYVEIEG